MAKRISTPLDFTENDQQYDPPPGMVPASQLTTEQSTAPAPPADESVPPIPSSTLSLTRDDLTSIITAAVQAANQGQSSSTDLVSMLTQALKASSPRRKLTVGERGEPKTRFNPTGANRFLKRRYFVNTYEVRPRSLHDSEIELLEKLEAGVYCKGRFKVIVVGENDAVPEVHVLWNNSSPESRVVIAKDFGTMTNILGAIYVDQQSQAKEKQDFSEYRRLKAMPGGASTSAQSE